MSGADMIARGLAAQTGRAMRAAVTRQRLWSRNFTGLRPIRTIASPPSVSFTGSSTSSVNASVINGANIPVRADSPLLRYTGPLAIAYDGPGATQGWAVPQRVAQSDGGRPTIAASCTVSFITDAPTFEVAFRDTQQARFNLLVDGEWLTRRSGVVPATTDTGNVRYMKFDFGANSRSFGLAAHQTIGASGSGYAVGDVLTLSGGTSTRPAKIKIVSAPGGAVANYAVEDEGDYSALPTYPIALTGGGGSGMTISAAYWTPKHTTRRLRHIDLVMHGGTKFVGIVTAGASTDLVIASPRNPRIPKLLIAGDSQNDGTFINYAGGTPAFTIAEMLGLRENVVNASLPGTGWATASGAYGAFGEASRLADYIAQAPDFLIFDGGQNDGGGKNAQVTTNIGATLNALQAALPDVLIVVIGSVVGLSAQTGYPAALAAGVALAGDQRRVRFINNLDEGWSFANQSYGATAALVASDTGHLGQYGNDEYRARIVAGRIANAFIEMVEGL